jgi:glycerol-3-phosphate dehydrogenase
LGTTDTDYTGPLDEPVCDAADTQYVLEVVNGTFPQSRLTPDDVVSHWAGLRPLVADPNGNPSDISRRHEVLMSHPGWWDVTGGKLTTYRLMAEETVDAIAKFLGRGRMKCETANRPLLDAKGTTQVSGILPPPVSESVVRHFCCNEWARHLADVMIRRTSWRHYRRDHMEVATRAALWMADELGWDEATRQAEIADYRARVNGQAAIAPHVVLSNGSGNGHAAVGSPDRSAAMN